MLKTLVFVFCFCFIFFIFFSVDTKRLKEHDPAEEPIVVLRCRHAYTLSTLDGCMGLASVYDKVRVR